ncbi:hypothetical protein HDU67_006210 [Dinochytrium kinnereticum]|nr:hypothetical protein HDU67_006210 [Dinochytrium kinnereticum]
MDHITPFITRKIDSKTFVQYTWGDAILYASDSLDLSTADQRNREYRRMTEVDPTPSNLQPETNLRPPEPMCKNLPSLLERDILMSFLSYRVIKVAVAVEGAFKKLSKLFEDQARSGCDALAVDLAFGQFHELLMRIERGEGLDLERVSTALAQALSGMVVFCPSIRLMLIFRAMTSWKLWSVHTSLYYKWSYVKYVHQFNRHPPVSPVKDIASVMWRSRECSVYCQKWSRKAIKVSVKTNGSHLSPVLTPMFDGSVQLGRGNFMKAASLWRRTIEFIDTLEDGGEIPSKNIRGEYAVPKAWRTARYLVYQKEVLRQRAVISESLEAVRRVVNAGKRLSARQTKKVSPGGSQTLGLLATQLSQVVSRLKTFGPFANADVFLANSVLDFIQDIQRTLP